MSVPRILLTGQDRAEAIWKKDAACPTITDIVSIRETYARQKVPSGLREHPARQLRLVFDDVPWHIPKEEYHSGPGARACTRAQIRRLVHFARGVDVDGVTLIHCAAGMSRSPAAALVLIATLLGPNQETAAVEHLIGLGRPVSPNPRVVYLADEVLCRGGRLFRAYRDRFWLGRTADYEAAYPLAKLAEE